MSRRWASMVILLSASALFSQAPPQLGQASLDEVIAAMTPAEKVQLLVGAGMAGNFAGAIIGKVYQDVPGAAGTTQPIPRLGIPAIVLADGPAGLRIAPRRDKDERTYYCTAFPVATMLASTFDAGLVEKVGETMGKEVLEYGVDVLLGPALNIHRNPLCGRNFEYYSEDPLLTGKMAAALVIGVQKNGVGTSIKHFAANNQETMRTGNDARMTTRALREIYLKGFEIVVRDAQPRTVMSSYNLINGVYTSQSRPLLTDILRGEWGFKGTVMSDWYGGKSAPDQIQAGNDLLMPGRADQAIAILSAQLEKKLEGKAVDACVRKVLQLILESPRFRDYAFSNAPDLKAHALVARQAAAEGMVLLKNSNTLPLPPQVKTIAAFGNTSYDFISGGTGSGDVNEAYTVSLAEGLTDAGYALDEGLKKSYETYLRLEEEKNKPDKSNPLAAFMPKKRPQEFAPRADLLAATASAANIAFITIGRTSGEFEDRKLEGDFLLTAAESGLIADVTRAFHKAGKKTVVILNVGGVIETASWKALPDAILLAWQGGQEAGHAVADVLSGQISPSGRLPMTWPILYDDIASSKNFPARVTLSREEMWADLMGKGKEAKDRRNIDYTLYEEDIYVGYRFFDTFKKAVSYPFGYGLSYTTFACSNPVVAAEAQGWKMTCTVKNTGKVAGKEAVQLYVSAPAKTLAKPAQELKAFTKTRLLQLGESQEVTFTLSPYDLASFDPARSAWVTEAGSYRLLLAASSREVRATATLKIAAEQVIPVHDVMRPSEKIATIR